MRCMHHIHCIHVVSNLQCLVFPSMMSSKQSMTLAFGIIAGMNKNAFETVFRGLWRKTVFYKALGLLYLFKKKSKKTHLFRGAL